MKTTIHVKNLPFLVLGLGGITLAILTALYLFGTDASGLISVGNPIPFFLALLAALTGVLVAVVVRKLGGSNRFADNYPASFPGAVGSFAAAAGVLITALLLLKEHNNPFALITIILGFLSVAGLVLAGISRLQGRRPFVLCHGALALFLALYLVWRYREWSADPQLLDYSFCLTASVMLMLHAYHRAAFDAGCGRRIPTLFFGLMSIYLCCGALASGDHPLLYLGCGAWVLTNLCPMTPPLRRKSVNNEPSKP